MLGQKNYAEAEQLLLAAYAELKERERLGPRCTTFESRQAQRAHGPLHRR